jgi:hypothetical protein
VRCVIPELSSTFWTAWEWRSLCIIWCLPRLSSIHDFGSVILLFSDTLISGMWSKNIGVMLLKSWTKDTRGRHQITRDDRYNTILSLQYTKFLVVSTIDGRLLGLLDPYYQHAISTFNTCSPQPAHWSLNNTGGGYNLEGAGLPHHTPRPSQPMVLYLPPKGPTWSQVNNTTSKRAKGESKP